MERKFLARHTSYFNMKIANCSMKHKFTLEVFISYFFPELLKIFTYGSLFQKNAFIQNFGLLKKSLKIGKTLSFDAILHIFLTFFRSNYSFLTLLL